MDRESYKSASTVVSSTPSDYFNSSGTGTALTSPTLSPPHKRSSFISLGGIAEGAEAPLGLCPPPGADGFDSVYADDPSTMYADDPVAGVYAAYADDPSNPYPYPDGASIHSRPYDDNTSYSGHSASVHSQSAFDSRLRLPPSPSAAHGSDGGRSTSPMRLPPPGSMESHSSSFYPHSPAVSLAPGEYARVEGLTSMGSHHMPVHFSEGMHVHGDSLPFRDGPTSPTPVALARGTGSTERMIDQWEGELESPSAHGHMPTSPAYYNDGPPSPSPQRPSLDRGLPLSSSQGASPIRANASMPWPPPGSARFPAGGLSLPEPLATRRGSFDDTLSAPSWSPARQRRLSGDSFVDVLNPIHTGDVSSRNSPQKSPLKRSPFKSIVNVFSGLRKKERESRDKEKHTGWGTAAVGVHSDHPRQYMNLDDDGDWFQKPQSVPAAKMESEELPQLQPELFPTLAPQESPGIGSMRSLNVLPIPQSWRDPTIQKMGDEWVASGELSITGSPQSAFNSTRGRPLPDTPSLGRSLPPTPDLVSLSTFDGEKSILPYANPTPPMSAPAELPTHPPVPEPVTAPIPTPVDLGIVEDDVPPPVPPKRPRSVLMESRIAAWSNPGTPATAERSQPAPLSEPKPNAGLREAVVRLFDAENGPEEKGPTISAAAFRERIRSWQPQPSSSPPPPLSRGPSQSSYRDSLLSFNSSDLNPSRSASQIRPSYNDPLPPVPQEPEPEAIEWQPPVRLPPPESPKVETPVGPRGPRARAAKDSKASPVTSPVRARAWPAFADKTPPATPPKDTVSPIISRDIAPATPAKDTRHITTVAERAAEFSTPQPTPRTRGRESDTSLSHTGSTSTTGTPRLSSKVLAAAALFEPTIAEKERSGGVKRKPVPSAITLETPGRETTLPTTATPGTTAPLRIRKTPKSDLHVIESEPVVSCTASVAGKSTAGQSAAGESAESAETVTPAPRKLVSRTEPLAIVTPRSIENGRTSPTDTKTVATRIANARTTFDTKAADTHSVRSFKSDTKSAVDKRSSDTHSIRSFKSDSTSARSVVSPQPGSVLERVALFEPSARSVASPSPKPGSVLDRAARFEALSPTPAPTAHVPTPLYPLSLRGGAEGVSPTESIVGAPEPETVKEVSFAKDSEDDVAIPYTLTGNEPVEKEADERDAVKSVSDEAVQNAPPAAYTHAVVEPSDLQANTQRSLPEDTITESTLPEDTLTESTSPEENTRSGPSPISDSSVSTVLGRLDTHSTEHGTLSRQLNNVQADVNRVAVGLGELNAATGAPLKQRLDALTVDLREVRDTVAQPGPLNPELTARIDALGNDVRGVQNAVAAVAASTATLALAAKAKEEKDEADEEKALPAPPAEEPSDSMFNDIHYKLDAIASLIQELLRGQEDLRQRADYNNASLAGLGTAVASKNAAGEKDPEKTESPAVDKELSKEAEPVTLKDAPAPVDRAEAAEPEPTMDPATAEQMAELQKQMAELQERIAPLQPLLQSDKELQTKQASDIGDYLRDLNSWLAQMVNKSGTELDTKLGDMHRMISEQRGLLSTTAGQAGRLDALLDLMNEERERFNAQAARLDHVVASIESQRQESEVLLRAVATDLTAEIRGERMRFIDAIQQATKVDVGNHVNEFKHLLNSEVSRTIHELGSMRDEKNKLEKQIADLFALKVKAHDALPASGSPTHLPMPQAHPLTPAPSSPGPRLPPSPSGPRTLPLTPY